ncbi:MAG: response regulator [Chthoniobacteraceae bacterium]
MLHSPQSSRILLVDDEVGHLCLLENMLNRIGYRHVGKVSDSREVFVTMAEFRPDLLILDLHMPHLDGCEVMQRLRKTVLADEHVPVLILTADLTPQAKRRALAAGAADVLTKPFDSSEAFMRIRNLIELRALERQSRGHQHALERTVAERTHELRESQRQIVQQERLRAFGEMAGGVVHDFNNALMSIIGYSEILLEDEAMLADPVMVRQFLKIMNTAGRDASHVIGRLREFYRPREESDVFVPVDLNKVLEEVVPITQPKWHDQALIAGKVIEIVFDLARIPLIQGNAAELREVATNLIFNAVDAMPHGGKITLRTRPEGASVVWEVCDEGAGMSDEVRTRCLEPFFSTKGEKGTGLGLSMVFGIIKRHDGQLDVDSAVGEGSTFRIRLPGIVDAFVPPVAGSVAAQRPLHILVVDDGAVTRYVLSAYLKADGHSVVCASDPVEALELFPAHEFDVLLLDFAMPGMNGLQLAAKIRQRRSDQRIILVTACSQDDLPPGEGTPGVDLVMRKPVPRSELRRALASVMQRTGSAAATADRETAAEIFA